MRARATARDESTHGLGADCAPLGSQGAARNVNRSRARIHFIAQKHLELLMTLRNNFKPAPRWWAVIDDDSFLFVDRLAHALSFYDDRQPLFLGGGHAQSPLCDDVFGCNGTVFNARHGHSSRMWTHSGGPGYALSDAALRRMGEAIDEGRCLDATFGDLATGACAIIASVRHQLLPGSFIVYGESRVREAAPGAFIRGDMVGRIIGFHRLNRLPGGNDTMLCWVRAPATRPNPSAHVGLRPPYVYESRPRRHVAGQARRRVRRAVQVRLSLSEAAQRHQGEAA